MKERHTNRILCGPSPYREVVSFVRSLFRGLRVLCHSPVAVLLLSSLQITAATAQASIVKKTLFNQAMKSKTKDLRRLAVSVVMVIDTG